ncbi:MAG: cytochrome c [Glaciecola sp.]
MFICDIAKRMRILFVLILSITSLSACAEPALVGKVDSGQEKSAICGQCHGKNGIAIIPIYPNLAGQKEAYMVLQLQAFRDGQRINAAMSPHARKLSDQDIADLSAYYARLDPAGSGQLTDK